MHAWQHHATRSGFRNGAGCLSEVLNTPKNYEPENAAESRPEKTDRGHSIPCDIQCEIARDVYFRDRWQEFATTSGETTQWGVLEKEAAKEGNAAHSKKSGRGTVGRGKSKTSSTNAV